MGEVSEAGSPYLELMSVIGPDRHEAVTFGFAEPYMIAAKLVELLERGGVALGNGNNLRAYR